MILKNRQSDFLNDMGISNRLKHMIRENLKNDEEEIKEIVSGCERLVEEGESGMGKIYKFMAIQPKGVRKPFSFGNARVVPE